MPLEQNLHGPTWWPVLLERHRSEELYAPVSSDDLPSTTAHVVAALAATAAAADASAARSIGGLEDRR